MSFRRLVASPTIAVSISISISTSTASSVRGSRRSPLCSNNNSSRRLIIHGHAFGCRDSRRRGFCWVRRPKPLPASAHRLDLCLSEELPPTSALLSPDVAEPLKVASNDATTHCDAYIKDLEESHSLRRTLNKNHASIRARDDSNRGENQEASRWFPYLDQFKVKEKVLTSSRILEMLSPFMSEERRNRIERVVMNRTYSICPVVEGLLDLGNIAAVFRSADALGFQSVHVIANKAEKRYKQNRSISMGSEKWLDAELFDSTKDCFEELRSRGYRIAVASLGHHSVPISEMDWTIPTAVVFGNELRGVSEDAVRLSDMQCFIPMEGMVDSFNVSVAAGILMHHAVNDRKVRLGKHGDLLPEEQSILSADFYLRHSSRSLSILSTLLQKKQEALQKSTLRSVLQGDLECNIDLPDYLRIDLEKVNL